MGEGEIREGEEGREKRGHALDGMCACLWRPEADVRPSLPSTCFNSLSCSNNKIPQRKQGRESVYFI